MKRVNWQFWRKKPATLHLEFRAAEMAWLDSHHEDLEQYRGYWMALDGSELVAYGPDLAKVLHDATDAGHPDPFITAVPETSNVVLRKRVTNDYTYNDLIGLLSDHVGETGESEGAVDVLRRLLKEHDCPLYRSGTKLATITG